MGENIVIMKSLLIITSFLPYPIHSGGEQAQYNMIEALRKTYHIGIVFPVNRDNRPSDIETLSFSWPDVRFFPFPLAGSTPTFHSFFKKSESSSTGICLSIGRMP